MLGAAGEEAAERRLEFRLVEQEGVVAAVGRDLHEAHGGRAGIERMRHQGSSFVERFDANSYLYITRAMDYFDLAAEKGGVLANAFRGTPVRFCLFSFTSDWLFPTRESRAVVQALNAAAANVSFVEIESDKGHDAFLLDEPEFEATLRGFLAGSAERRGIA